MNLTKNEAACFLHRLECRDEVAEVVADWFGYDVDEIEMSGPLNKVRKWFDNGTPDDTDFDEWDREVIAECVEGSTWVASASCESGRTIAGATRTLESLAKKLAPIVGRELEVPYA